MFCPKTNFNWMCQINGSHVKLPIFIWQSFMVCKFCLWKMNKRNMWTSVSTYMSLEYRWTVFIELKTIFIRPQNTIRWKARGPMQAVKVIIIPLQFFCQFSFSWIRLVIIFWSSELSFGYKILIDVWSNFCI